MPGPPDAEIDAQDGLLITRAYSDDSKYTDMAALSSSLAATLEYGFSIRNPCLRSTILAIAASDLDPVQFGSRERDHKDKALKLLGWKVSQPDTICEADAFSSCLLAMLAWEKCSDEELATHIRGTLAILEHLNTTSASRNESHLFKVFKPYIIHWMHYLSTCASVSRWPISGQIQSILRPTRKVTFKERVVFFDRFTSIRVPRLAWHSGTMEALHDILTDSVQQLTRCIYGVAKRQRDHIFQFRESCIQETLDHVGMELSDHDLQNALHIMMKAAETAPPSPTLEVQLATYQLDLREGIELARSILKTPNIIGALSSRLSDTEQRAKKLLSSYRRMKYQQDPTMRKYYLLSYPENVLLAAMALGPNELSRKHSLLLRLTG